MDEKELPEAYIPSETIRVKIFKPEIGYSQEVDIMPSQLPEVQKLVQQGFKVTRVASEKTSTLGAFAGGILQGASLNLEEEIYGVLGGDEVQKEAEQQRQRELEERPIASIAGQVVGSLIGAPAKIAGLTTKAASKLGPVASRVIKGLTGVAEGTIETLGAKPMGEKDKFSPTDVIAPLIGGVAGAATTAGKKATEAFPEPQDVPVTLKPEVSQPAKIPIDYNEQVKEAKKIIQQRKEQGTHQEIAVINNKVVDQNNENIPITLYRGSTVEDPLSTRQIRSFISFSTNPRVARTYSGDRGFITTSKIELERPLIIDADGNTVNKVPIITNQGPKVMDTDKIVNQAKKAGYDGVVIKNVQTQGPKERSGFLSPEEKLGTNVFVFDSKNIVEPKTISTKEFDTLVETKKP